MAVLVAVVLAAVLQEAAVVVVDAAGVEAKVGTGGFINYDALKSRKARPEYGAVPKRPCLAENQCRG
uniref:Expressed+protein n=1 Tax=Oryza brachyantha TaxID=4533 RepID=G8JB95_ORYBR|nr:expressed+protein [Oryza brachyantha]